MKLRMKQISNAAFYFVAGGAMSFAGMLYFYSPNVPTCSIDPLPMTEELIGKMRAVKCPYNFSTIEKMHYETQEAILGIKGKVEQCVAKPEPVEDFGW